MKLAQIDYLANSVQGPLHKVNPLLKTALLFFFLAAIIAVNEIAKLLFALLLLCVLFLVSRVPLWQVGRLALYPAFFSLLFALIIAQGSPAAGAMIVLKAVGAALSMLLLISTTSYVELFSILSTFLPALVVDILVATYRSVFILLEQFENLFKSVRLRGGYHLWRVAINIRSMIGVLALLVIHALESSERMHRIYSLRGYKCAGPSKEDLGAFNYVNREGAAVKPLVKVKCLKHIYPDQTEVNICGLDFIVREGERVVILGANGAGKTTILAHILGLLSPVEGTVEVMGLRPDKDFRILRRYIGAVFQNVEEQIIGPRVYDDLAFTPRNEGMPPEEVHRLVSEIAQKLGIEGILDKIPHYLSSGQKKKVALAGALIMSPKLLVLDEPFNSLDPCSKKEIIELLNDLNAEKGTSLVIATHDMEVVSGIADTVYLLCEGQIIARGSPQEVFSSFKQLEQAKLEPPPLLRLFSSLKAQGLPVSIPQNVEEAEQQLLSLFLKADSS
ncbi:MAG: ATP-binding cassette domain-containing protein [Dethiobacteria bacterium]|jgi:cobalt/nickel transport system ATP-binding protein